MSANKDGSSIFYVDSTGGHDGNDGGVDAPFRTLDRALVVVRERVGCGICSDKIYLRGGVYRKESVETLYRLNLKGTSENYAMISAMPAEPNTPGAVQRKSGKWYEKVVFDDAHVIATIWERHPDRPDLWQTRPGFVQSNWYENATWPWRGVDLPEEKQQVTPFTVASYMLLQDGEPFLWAVGLNEMTGPGLRTYDQETDTLTIWPLGDADPNTCKMETWYGGPEEDGKMLLDGEGRSLFDGDMEYAGICGCEFRMFTRLFEFKRREMAEESERVFQHHVRFEDNLCRYGWIQILLDANVVWPNNKGIYTRFDDRCDWQARHNVFYRPGREVFQLHGPDHVFEHNEIIEHGGPWAGPAACVSSVNTRNTTNAQIRHNYIQGQGDNRWHSGSVFMIEVGAGHADENGDYIYGGQTYEGNLIVDQTRGPAMMLGKGGARMRDVTVRNNIFSGHKEDPTIVLSSPHTNLKIEGNVFYDQAEAIAIRDMGGGMRFESLPSTIAICDNTFAKNKKAISARLQHAPKGSEVIVEGNICHKNGEE